MLKLKPSMKYLFKTKVVFILLFISKMYAQQQFGMRYKFDNSMFTSMYIDSIPDNTGGINHSIATDSIYGYVLRDDGTKLPVHIVARRIPVPKTINGSLKGVIDFRDGDNLYFHFWDIISTPLLSATNVDAGDNGKDFFGTINWNGELHIDIPFYFSSFSATYIPFKYDFCRKTTESSFLNFNAAYLFMWGRTRYFKNDDIKPRNTYAGLGGYFGGTNLQTDPQYLNQLGVTYGITGVFSFYGLNTIGSFGFENGLTHQTSAPHFYVGIGIGYNLVSFFGTSN